MQTNLDSVGKRVACARKYRSLTQHELADKANIAQSSLATLEAERTKSSRNLVAIAMALDVPAEWLATGKHAGTAVGEIFVKAPAWDASPSEKNLHNILKTSVLGEYTTAYNATENSAITSSPVGLKLLAWTTTALLDPDHAYKRQLEQQSRFKWPFEHGARAFLLRVTRDFCVPELRENDLILIEPDAEAGVGKSIIAVSPSQEILLGRVLNSTAGKKLLTSVQTGSEQIHELNEQSKIVGVIASRLQRL